jgi:hypothetical protein
VFANGPDSEIERLRAGPRDQWRQAARGFDREGAGGAG